MNSELTEFIKKLFCISGEKKPHCLLQDDSESSALDVFLLSINGKLGILIVNSKY